VPIGLGERLYALINAPKRFVRFPGAGHNDLGANGSLEAGSSFSRRHPREGGILDAACVLIHFAHRA
jgi:hypothetical protein